MSDDKDRVKQAIDIVSYIQTNGITLKKESRLFVGLCPFHSEKHGSFTVYPETQSYHCFGCHVDGDIFTFAMKRNHWTFPEALEELARYANITLEPLSPAIKEKQDKRERQYTILAEAAKIYQGYLSRYEGQAAERYLTHTRGLSMETIKEAQIGYALPHIRDIVDPLRAMGYSQSELAEVGILSQDKEDKSTFYAMFRNRAMIPLRDHRGRVVGFVGRALNPDDNPKYLTGSATDLFQKSDLIYRPTSRVKNAQGEAQHTIVVVEGQMDAISALNRGFENVVAQMGSTLTERQMDQICKGNPARVVFCLDKDDAGRKALRTLTEKHITRLASKGITLLAMFSPHGKDPDDCFRERPDLWEPAVTAARPVVDVLIDLEWAKLGDRPSAVDISKMVNELLPILKSDNLFIENENIHTLARKTGVAFDRLKNWLAPQMHVMDKPSPAPKVETIGLPTNEEWVLHGILRNEADAWLTRANSCLLIASDSPMPYALAPLSAQDFTDAQLRRFFEICAKSQAAETMIRANIDKPLEALYERIKHLDEIGQQFGLTFDYDVFIERVYELRLARLQREHPTFEGAKARECAMAIACLHLAAEELI